MIGDYLKRIRDKIGHDKIIHPAARAIIENDQGECLFILRNDNGRVGLPAGGLEENETIVECVIREVKEESGLTMIDPVCIGIDSRPEIQTHTYQNGDCVQYFVVEFYCNNYLGSLRIEDIDEVACVGFHPFSYSENLPDLERSTFHSLRHYRELGFPLVR